MVARVLEERGIATVTLATMREVAEIVKAPRTVLLKFPFGSPIGRPGKVDNQITVLTTALDTLEKTAAPEEIVDPSFKY